MNAQSNGHTSERLHVAPGFRVVLTNPYELILNDSRGSAIVLRDDDVKRPVIAQLFEVLKRRSFTREEMLAAMVGNGRQDGPEILELLMEQAVVIDDVAAPTFGVAPPLVVSVLGTTRLVTRLLADLGNALDVKTQLTAPSSELDSASIAAALDGVDAAVYLGPLDTKLLETLNDVALERSTTVIPLLLLDSRSALIGPTVIPGRTACLRELLLWMMNADLIPQSDPTQQIGAMGSFESGDLVAYRPLESLMLGFLMEMLLELRRMRPGGRLSAYTGRAVFVNLERRLVTIESVLRIPGCTQCATLTGATFAEEAIPAALVREVQVEAGSR